MKLGSLFAGIGGFELAATWAGIEPVWSNEIDKFACKILKKNFDHEIIEKDIREIGKSNLCTVDIISGGFPCQPFSQAGLKKGVEDDRYLWPETIRVVSELRPTWFIGENVAGLLSMAQPIWESWVESKTHLSDEEEDVVIQRAEWFVLNRIIQDLEEIGYQVQTFNIPAVAVGTHHRRGRLWIVAYTDSSTNRKQKSGIDDSENKKTLGIRSKNSTTRDIGGASTIRETNSRLFDISNPEDYWETEPRMDRVVNGIPNRVDRIKGLGNAIVPQVIYQIFKGIKQLNDEKLR